MERWIDRSLVKYLKNQFQIDWNGFHGGAHWARVKQNARLIARQCEASGQTVDYDVLDLFSILHDHKRKNEGYDIEHGKRAADALHFYRGRFFELPDAVFTELWTACAYHSDGLTKDPSINVRICWDADRLDLYRVGVMPSAQYLCTEEAKKASFIEAAVKRSLRQK